mgnify:CR=1 FL=1
MYILSIDVGIKNLAYCLFHLKSDTDFSIAKWSIIDLVSDQNMICGKSKKNGDKCQYQAKYCKNNEYYCKKHAKSSDTYLIANTELNKVKYPRMACHKLKALVEKQGIALDNDKKYTKTELTQLLDTFIEDKCFDIVSEKKCADINLVMLGRKICEKFDKELANIKVDCVIIENQISPIANRMKTIQGMIAQYFIMNETKTIEFISASNKLKQWVKRKTKYSERKKLGIQVTLDLIANNNQFKIWDSNFVSSKKQDDLADSFLQGIWYIQDNNLVNVKTTLSNI